MTTARSAPFADEAILVGRILLLSLFLVFGWGKLTNFSGAVAYMTHTGVPLPWLAALVAVIVEFFVSIVLLFGVATRPLAWLMIFYTFGAGYLAHKFWTMTGSARFANKIDFYSDISIMGGFLLLYVTGPGKYSLDGTVRRLVNRRLLKRS